MRTFLDSSALAKRYIDEPHSDKVERILRDASSLGVSIVCIPEIISALCRRRRERSLSRPDYSKAKDALMGDVADADVVQLTAEVLEGGIDLLERNHLRAMDALHVGCALVWDADLFVSSDRKQLRAASKAGLKTARV